MVQQYKQKHKMLDKTQKDKPKDDFFDNIAIDIFLFAATIISMLTIVAIIHLVCRHSKLKALLTGIAFQPVNQAEAVVTKQAKEFCTAQWYAITDLNRVDNIAYCITFVYPTKNVLCSKEDFIQIQ